MALAKALQTQPQNLWPMSLAGSAHMRPCIVVARDSEGKYFAIRATSGGPGLDITKLEAFLFEQLRANGVQAVLQSKFGSQDGNKSIESTVDFILRLHEHGLLEPLSNHDLMQSIEMLASQHRDAAKSGPRGDSVANSATTTTFLSIAGHPAVSWLIGAALITLCINPVMGATLSIDSAVRLLETPAATLGALWLAILATSTIYGLCANAMTQGALPASLRTETVIKFERRGLFFLIANFDSNAVDMLTRAEELRLRASFLALPWIGCGLAAIASGGGIAGGSFLMTFAFAFALVGLRETSPLERGQLVAFLEAWARRSNLLESTRSFLRKGLLRFDHEIAGGEGVLATTMIAWMAALTFYGSEILISSVYELGNQVSTLASDKITHLDIANAVASVAWLIMLAIVSVGGMIRLAAIPFQNVFNLAAIPLRALRPKALLALTNKMTPQNLTRVMSGIPIFSDLSTAVLTQAIHLSKILHTMPSELLVKQGDLGQDFYVILDGDFQVEVRDENGQLLHHELLIAGDSFGEIAIIQHGARTATVKSMGHGVVLSVSEAAFDLMFPKSLKTREDLTRIMRIVKLVQESDGLSYLTATQTLNIARAVTPKSSKAGDVLIVEGDPKADFALLINSGSVKVTLKGRVLAENLSRGQLAGTTALMNDSPRTASVICTVDATFFVLGRQDFMNACSSNAVIAILLGNMTGAHLKSQKTVGQDGDAAPQKTERSSA